MENDMTWKGILPDYPHSPILQLISLLYFTSKMQYVGPNVTQIINSRINQMCYICFSRHKPWDVLEDAKQVSKNSQPK